MKRTSEAHVDNAPSHQGAREPQRRLHRGVPAEGRYAAEAPLASRLVHYTGYEITSRTSASTICATDGRCMSAPILSQMRPMYLEKCAVPVRGFVWQDRSGHSATPRIVRTARPNLIIKDAGFYEYVARMRIQKKLTAPTLRRVALRPPSLYHRRSPNKTSCAETTSRNLEPPVFDLHSLSYRSTLVPSR